MVGGLHRSALLALTLVLVVGTVSFASRAWAGQLEPFLPDTSQPQAMIAQSAAAEALVGSGDSNSSGLPLASSDPSRWRLGSINGEYQIASVGPMVASGALAVLSGDEPNVSISVDGRLILDRDSASDATLRVGCRYQAAGPGYSGYALSFAPSGNAWSIDRFDAGTVVPLTEVQYLKAPPSITSTHHLMLSCSGSTISASVDGMQLASVQDGSYQDGSAMLGVGTFTRESVVNPPGGAYPGTIDARFSHLVVTQP